MATTRTVTADAAGAAFIDARTVALDVQVIIEPGRTHAELTLSTEDDEGPSAELVNKATLTASGNHLNVNTQRVEESTGGGGMTVIQTGRGSIRMTGSGGVFVSGGGRVNVSGAVGRNISIVNGRVVGGDISGVVFGGSEVTVVARVPDRSAVTATTISGAITAQGQGEFAQVSANSTSGAVDVEKVTRANVQTVSGAIDIAELTSDAMLNSVSGAIGVHGAPSARASASTVSGSIRGTGGIDLHGNSISGSVRSR